MGSKTQLKVDIAKIKRALAILFTSGDVAELRELGFFGGTYAGYLMAVRDVQ